MKYAKSYIDEIIKFYVENPKYLLIPLILSILFTIGWRFFYPTWAIETYVIIGVTSFPGFALIIAQIIGYWKETTEEKEYDNILTKPFKQKFIIPPLRTNCIINYYPQDDNVHRLGTINIPENTTTHIIIKTKTELELEVRDSQYSFGGNVSKKKPEILKYDNKFYKESLDRTKWFEKDLGKDWWENHHLSGRRLMFKDVAYMDGFKIQTFDKGKFTFNMEFIVVCKKYKNLEKEKPANIRTKLKINVI